MNFLQPQVWGYGISASFAKDSGLRPGEETLAISSHPDELELELYSAYIWWPSKKASDHQKLETHVHVECWDLSVTKLKSLEQKNLSWPICEMG